MRQEDPGLVSRLYSAWQDILALFAPQGVGSDSLLLYNSQTQNAWDITGDFLSGSNADSQWTVTFTPADISKPVYCEFEYDYQITSGSTAYDYETYTWDDPSTTSSVIKKFIVWKQNSPDTDQVIRFKFGVRSAQPGTVTWVRNR